MTDSANHSDRADHSDFADRADLPRNLGDARRATAGVPGVLGRLSEGLREFYFAPYRRTFARARRDEDDLFMIAVLGEALGVPNPATWYTLELLPVTYDHFHDWHRRMGHPRSPLDEISCC